MKRQTAFHGFTSEEVDKTKFAGKTLARLGPTDDTGEDLRDNLETHNLEKRLNNLRDM